MKIVTHLLFAYAGAGAGFLKILIISLMSMGNFAAP